MVLPVTGRLHRNLSIFAYCTALFLAGLCVNVVGPAGPTLCSSTHASLSMIGNIFAAEGAGNTLGSSLISYLLDRYPGHSVLRTLCLVVFFVVGVIPSCTSLYHVVALYVIVGGCLGLLSGTCSTMVAWVQAGRNVGPWLNLVNASFGLGASSAPLLFMLSERRYGNGLVAFSAIGLFAAVPATAVALLRSPQAPAPKEAPEKEEEDQPGHGLGSGHGRSTILGVDLCSRAAYVRVTVIAPLMLTTTLVIGAEIAFAGWVYAYAIARAHMATTAAACLNSLFWTTFTVGRVCTIPLAACLTPGQILVPTMVLEVASILSIVLNPGSARALWIGTLGAGIGVCALYSNVLSLLATFEMLTPKTVSAIAMAAALGHMTVPNLVGAAVSAGAGFDALMWIVLAAHTIGLVLVSSVVMHLSANFTPAHVIKAAAKGGALSAATEACEAL